jgi:hypothetical protein
MNASRFGLICSASTCMLAMWLCSDEWALEIGMGNNLCEMVLREDGVNGRRVR